MDKRPSTDPRHEMGVVFDQNILILQHKQGQLYAQSHAILFSSLQATDDAG